MATPLELRGVDKFDPNVNPTQLGQAWERWHRAFELFATGRGIRDPDQKRALLLHHAGLEVQDIYFTLEETSEEGDDAYKRCVKTLKNHFSPKVNVPYERYEFRNIKQEPGETVEQYITKLRRKSVLCKFDKPDEAIRDQVIEKCNSHRLRVKLLEKGDGLTLEQLRVIASTMEMSDLQSKSMSVPSAESSTVNKVSGFRGKGQRSNDDKRSKSSSTGSKTGKCYRCGSANHFAKDPSCPAKTKKCHKCKNIGHFEKCCKTKPKGHVRQVYAEHDSEDDGNLYAFNVKADSLTKHEIYVGDIPIKVVIDSGSTANIIDKDTWEHLKRKKVSCYSSHKTEKRLFAYGSSKP